MSGILDKLTRTLGSEYRDLNTEANGTVTYIMEQSLECSSVLNPFFLFKEFSTLQDKFINLTVPLAAVFRSLYSDPNVLVSLSSIPFIKQVSFHQLVFQSPLFRSHLLSNKQTALDQFRLHDIFVHQSNGPNKPICIASFDLLFRFSL